MKEQINFKDCILGEIYYSSRGYIMRHHPKRANNLSINHNHYYHNCGDFSGSAHEIRLATPEERDWFIACERERKFIPKEDVKPEIINDYQIY